MEGSAKLELGQVITDLDSGYIVVYNGSSPYS